MGAGRAALVVSLPSVSSHWGEKRPVGGKLDCGCSQGILMTIRSSRTSFYLGQEPRSAQLLWALCLGRVKGPCALYPRDNLLSMAGCSQVV